MHGIESIYMAIFVRAYLNYIKTKNNWNAIFIALGIYFGAFQYECNFYKFLPQIEIWEIKTFYNTIDAIFFTAAVVNGFGIRFFENKFIQFLGEISFSLYLLHFIGLCSLSCAIYIRFPQNKIYLLANFISYVLVCFLLSKLFEKYIDKQAINLSHKFSAYICKQSFKPTPPKCA
jgi:peptidoglycan/LPS O-acetylase OafA/YrhL